VPYTVPLNMCLLHSFNWLAFWLFVVDAFQKSYSLVFLSGDRKSPELTQHHEEVDFGNSTSCSASTFWQQSLSYVVSACARSWYIFRYSQIKVKKELGWLHTVINKKKKCVKGMPTYYIYIYFGLNRIYFVANYCKQKI